MSQSFHRCRIQLFDHVATTFTRCLSIVRRKNMDYSAAEDPFSNFKSGLRIGIPVQKAIMVRFLDKVERICNLMEHDAYVTDESMEDTIDDAINYLALLKAARELLTSPQPEP